MGPFYFSKLRILRPTHPKSFVVLLSLAAISGVISSPVSRANHTKASAPDARATFTGTPSTGKSVSGTLNFSTPTDTTWIIDENHTGQATCTANANAINISGCGVSMSTGEPVRTLSISTVVTTDAIPSASTTASGIDATGTAISDPAAEISANKRVITPKIFYKAGKLRIMCKTIPYLTGEVLIPILEGQRTINPPEHGMTQKEWDSEIEPFVEGYKEWQYNGDDVPLFEAVRWKQKKCTSCRCDQETGCTCTTVLKTNYISLPGAPGRTYTYEEIQPALNQIPHSVRNTNPGWRYLPPGLDPMSFTEDPIYFVPEDPASTSSGYTYADEDDDVDPAEGDGDEYLYGPDLLDEYGNIIDLGKLEWVHRSSQGKGKGVDRDSYDHDSYFWNNGGQGPGGGGSSSGGFIAKRELGALPQGQREAVDGRSETKRGMANQGGTGDLEKPS
ncbi:uncharacterized protein DFL_009008 [Arthrobotrys flagrans]|uniref:Uncharacterized protein n=1 Tax=Arthrobotrys flagrans TaxID=97331 RepID=A0A436ZQR5_ARTFL|nr:hypothetical protein DFL_009008 [Arthrobotrys flagrans]